MYDVLIRNGMVFDGSGSAPEQFDVAVKDGRVVALGTALGGEAAQTIDASGRYVSPGFIDPHTHSDMSLLVEPDGDSKLRQGVTTEVVGNCGDTPAPAYGQWITELQNDRFANTGVDVTWRSFGDYVARLKELQPIVNVVPLVGHGAIRGSVLGIDDRAPDAGELQRMKELTQTAMEEGAWGMSSGLIYPPGVYAQTDELVDLAKVVGRYGGLYASHVRGEGRTVLSAVNEAIDIGVRAQVPVQVSHVKICGYRTFERIDELMRIIDESANADVPVNYDQYPYIASSTTLLVVLPEWTYVGGVDASTKRLADPEVRTRLRRYMEEDPAAFWDNAGTKDWDGVLITDYAPNRSYQGKSVGEVARLLNRDGLDTLLDLLVDANCVVSCVLFDQDESILRRIMRHSRVMVGSDGYSVKKNGYINKRAMHPRSYGTFVRVLGHWTRDEGVLEWLQAIHKMTGLPAQAFGLTDRGILRAGAWADIVVFDPQTVIDKATFTDAHQYAAGIDCVLVNGKLAVANGETTGTRAGEVLVPPRG